MRLYDLLEALTDLQIKDALSMTHDAHGDLSNNPKHSELNQEWIAKRDAFLNKHPIAKQMFSDSTEKRKYQLRFPITLQPDESEPNSEVFQYLQNASGVRCSADDYKKGYLWQTKMVGVDKSIPKEIKISIGKYLAQYNNELKKIFDSSHQSTNTEFDIIITGHPIDVYGMSTGRGWASCQSLNSKQFVGDNSHMDILDKNPGWGNVVSNVVNVKNEIINQTHMAYLVKRGGDIDHDAIARIALKPHKKLGTSDATLISDGIIYGTAPKQFIDKVNEISEELFKIEYGIYQLNNQCYAETAATKEIGNINYDEEYFKKLLDTATPDNYLDIVRFSKSQLNDPDDSNTIVEYMYSILFKNTLDKLIFSAKTADDYYLISDYLFKRNPPYEVVEDKIDTEVYREISNMYPSFSDTKLCRELSNKLFDKFITAFNINPSSLNIHRTMSPSRVKLRAIRSYVSSM